VDSGPAPPGIGVTGLRVDFRTLPPSPRKREVRPFSDVRFHQPIPAHARAAMVQKSECLLLTHDQPVSIGRY
jgi:hypothetical protein